MQRTLLAALALATLGTSALAQSSVTMYGRLNLTLESQKRGDAKEKGLYNNASRIGMKGTEDLGGGLKAGFQIEHGFNADTGAATGGAAGFWGRQSEVNLSGGFGMLRLGNFTSEAYFATADYISFHNHDTGSSSDAFYADTRDFRQSDKVAYRTPSFGNATVEVALNLRDVAGVDPERTTDIALNWGSGPLSVGAGYQKTGDRKQFALRGMYEAGALTFGSYIQRDTDVYGAGNRTTLRFSGMYTIGNTELHANFGRAGDYSESDETAANQITLGVNYNLSKRTKAYGYITRVSNGANATYSVSNPGDDFRSLAAGIRHNF
jgi:predicted porin